MKIEKIQVYQVDLPLKERSYKWSDGKLVETFDCTVVELRTDAGITGWGEVWNYDYYHIIITPLHVFTRRYVSLVILLSLLNVWRLLNHEEISNVMLSMIKATNKVQID